MVVVGVFVRKPGVLGVVGTADDERLLEALYWLGSLVLMASARVLRLSFIDKMGVLWPLAVPDLNMVY